MPGCGLGADLDGLLGHSNVGFDALGWLQVAPLGDCLLVDAIIAGLSSCLPSRGKETEHLFLVSILCEFSSVFIITRSSLLTSNFKRDKGVFDGLVSLTTGQLVCVALATSLV